MFSTSSINLLIYLFIHLVIEHWALLFDFFRTRNWRDFFLFLKKNFRQRKIPFKKKLEIFSNVPNELTCISFENNFLKVLRWNFITSNFLFWPWLLEHRFSAFVLLTPFYFTLSTKRKFSWSLNCYKKHKFIGSLYNFL